MTNRDTDNVESFPAQGGPDQRARDAHSTASILLRQLDLWCRSHRASPTLNRWVADEALRQTRGQARWLSPSRPLPRVMAGDDLPAELRRWPAPWRYRVAALERRGMARAHAVQLARAEHAASCETATPQCA